MKYLDRLSEKNTDSAKAKQYAQAATRESLQMQAHLLETQSQLQSAKDSLEAAKSASPLSVARISELMDRVEGLEKGEARIVALQAELFGA